MPIAPVLHSFEITKPIAVIPTSAQVISDDRKPELHGFCCFGHCSGEVRCTRLRLLEYFKEEDHEDLYGKPINN